LPQTNQIVHTQRERKPHDTSFGLNPLRLGKKIELRYIPFSELVITWEVCIDSNVEPKHDSGDVKQLKAFPFETLGSSRALKILKQENLEALKSSIVKFGLLKPFEVAELPEKLDFFFGKGKYVVIDGQRRYFAIRELLKLPTEYDERRQRDSLRTHSNYEHIEKAEMQAQEQFENLSIRDFVLIPCLVFPYKTYLQMLRHSTEDKRLSVKPSRELSEIVEKMHKQGIADLTPDDLSNFWEIQKRIEEERQAIEKTLQEIRNARKEGKHNEDKEPNLKT